jgi:hypothetical protein
MSLSQMQEGTLVFLTIPALKRCILVEITKEILRVKAPIACYPQKSHHRCR